MVIEISFFRFYLSSSRQKRRVWNAFAYFFPLDIYSNDHPLHHHAKAHLHIVPDNLYHYLQLAS